MNKYDNLELLEFFDLHIVHDKDAGIQTYEVTSEDGITLTVFIIACESSISFNLRSSDGMLVDFGFRDLSAIVCDNKKPGVTMFLFYRNNKNIPVVTVMIKPRMSMTIDFDKG